MRLRHLIGKDKLEIIKAIEEALGRLFSPSTSPNNQYTPHALAHAKQIESYIEMLMDVDDKVPVSKEELFWLLAAVYLHDIGMSIDMEVLELVNDEQVKMFIADTKSWPKDSPKNLPQEILMAVRQNHSKTTVEYIRKHGQKLGIKDEYSRYVISLICGLHTENWLPSDQRQNLKILTRSNNVLVLAAMLRLGDILHSDYSRIEDERFHIEIFPTLPIASWIHWAKHLLLQKVSPKPKDGVIDLVFTKPSEVPDGAIFDDIVKKIQSEIQQEIDRTRDVIFSVGLPAYHIVRVNMINNSKDYGPLSPEEERRIGFFLNQYKISRQISASGVEKAILLTLDDIVLHREWNIRSFDNQVYQPIKRLVNFAYESHHGNKIIKLIGNKALEVLKPIHEAKALHDGNNIKLVNDIQQGIRGILNNSEKNKTSAFKKMRDITKKNIKTILDDNDCILLYSYSTTVIECLKGLSKSLKSNLRCLIVEGRNKCIEPFSDAIAYANGLAEIDFNTENIRFITEASIGNFIIGSKNQEYKVKKVFLGAGDGWVDRPQKSFWLLNTVGSRIITHMARQFNVKVVVFAESSKFAPEPPPEDRCINNHNFDFDSNAPDLDRLLKNLGKYSINDVIIDPVQDKIPSSEVDFLITDKNIYRQNEFDDFISSIN